MIGLDVNITTLDDAELRAWVAAWGAGATPEERAASCAIAEAAYRELAIRRDVDRRLGRRVLPLPSAPWLEPQEPRVRSWERPTRSTIYPDAP